MVPKVASPRAEVAHTIALRRRKGTATVLERGAAGVLVVTGNQCHNLGLAANVEGTAYTAAQLIRVERGNFCDNLVAEVARCAVLSPPIACFRAAAVGQLRVCGNRFLGVGPDARAVEYFQRLCATQYMNRLLLAQIGCLQRLLGQLAFFCATCRSNRRIWARQPILVMPCRSWTSNQQSRCIPACPSSGQEVACMLGPHEEIDNPPRHLVFRC